MEVTDDWTHWLFCGLLAVIWIWGWCVLISEWRGRRRFRSRTFFGTVRPYDYQIDGECFNAREAHLRLLLDDERSATG